MLIHLALSHELSADLLVMFTVLASQSKALWSTLSSSQAMKLVCLFTASLF